MHTYLFSFLQMNIICVMFMINFIIIIFINSSDSALIHNGNLVLIFWLINNNHFPNKNFLILHYFYTEIIHLLNE